MRQLDPKALEAAMLAFRNKPYTEAVKAAIGAYLDAAEEWQPIETAPKDGTVVEVWASLGNYDPRRWISYFDTGWQKSWRINSGGNLRLHKPTHWRPLPAPPKDKSEGEG